MTRTIAEIEAEYGQRVIAVIYNTDGTVYDHAFNWETAQSMALSDGYLVKAIADDGSMTKDDIQALCDTERARYIDCYGLCEACLKPRTTDPDFCPDCLADMAAKRKEIDNV